ncbi:protein FAM228B isoform X1 [Notamacropus eugenii]|uniref:protein FAM228B isoform X1 n=1 Tax=Notamacropus eugenii TaxID=9315 RepID=UPI003B6858A2
MPGPGHHGDGGRDSEKGSPGNGGSPAPGEQTPREGGPGSAAYPSLLKAPDRKQGLLLSPWRPAGRAEEPSRPRGRSGLWSLRPLGAPALSLASSCPSPAAGSFSRAPPAGQAGRGQGSREGDPSDKPQASWSGQRPAQVRILGVSEHEDSESVKSPPESLLCVTTVKTDLRGTDSQTQRSSKGCPEAPDVPFAETLVKDDIDAAVEVILCRENYIIKELDKYLQRQDFLNARRKEMLHKRWVENVACPLQQKIINKVGSPKEIQKRKRLELDGYLRFRDATVTLPPFRDPLLQAQQDRDEENRAILQCETGKLYTMKEFKEIEKAERLAKLPQSSLARHHISPNQWLKIPARYMESELCRKSRLKVRVNRNRISSDFRKVFYPSETNGEADSSQEDTYVESCRTWTSFPKLSHGEMRDEKRGLVQSGKQPVPRKREGIIANYNQSVCLWTLSSLSKESHLR